MCKLGPSQSCRPCIRPIASQFRPPTAMTHLQHSGHGIAYCPRTRRPLFPLPMPWERVPDAPPPSSLPPPLQDMKPTAASSFVLSNTAIESGGAAGGLTACFSRPIASSVSRANIALSASQPLAMNFAAAARRPSSDLHIHAMDEGHLCRCAGIVWKCVRNVFENNDTP